MTTDETVDREPGSGIRADPQDRVLLSWQWIFGCAAAVAVFAAAFLSTSAPQLTYEDLTSTGESVTVECVSTARGFGGQQLSDPLSTGFTYEITEGEAAYDAWYKHELEGLAGVDPGFRPSDGINAGCANATAERFRIAVWVLALGLALGLGFVWVSVTRARDASMRPSAVRSASDVRALTSNAPTPNDPSGEPPGSDRDR